jgi:carboxylesterase
MTPTPSPVLPGCEPFSAAGGPLGALVVHGYTGSPQSVRPLAEAFAAAGLTVELPLLPGHGTSVDDLVATRFDDWAGAAEAAYEDLAARCDGVVVAGLSMGGTLTLWLASRHPEVAGIVLVNPMAEPPAETFRDILRQSLAQGIDRTPAIGSDIADPAMREKSYDATPIAPLLSLFEAQDALAPRLGEVRCPVLLCTSPQDHVVPPSSSDFLAERLPGPVERVTLARSYHVATLDYDRPLIEERAVDFALRRLGALDRA